MTRNDTSPRSRAGFTILETMIAVALSSLLFVLVLFLYDAFARMTHEQDMQSDQQESLMIVRRAIEKDIHKSGYNLPGNGVTWLELNYTNPTLVFISNENNKQTALYKNVAASSDLSVLVNDANGVSAKQWICLKEDSLVGYRKITYVGMRQGGAACDTVFVNGFFFTPWNTSSTQVYFGDGVYYSIDSTPGLKSSKHLTRYTTNSSIALGPSIDTIKYVAKDTTGDLSWSDYHTYAKIRSLQITVAGPSLGSPLHTRQAKSFEVMLRN
jgi:type II secretory pathway component PulJ